MRRDTYYNNTYYYYLLLIQPLSPKAPLRVFELINEYCILDLR